MTQDAAKLYSFADVDRSGKVRWTLAELGLPVEEARLKLGMHREAEYLALNPYAQIPTLQLGDDVLIESSAICMVLAERHPKAQLIPESGAARESFWRFSALANSTLEAPVVNYLLSGMGIIDERWKELVGGGLKSRLQAFANEIPVDGYLCGDFSLADIFAAYVLRIGVQADLLEYSGNMANWMDRLRARPGAQQSKFFASLDS